MATAFFLPKVMIGLDVSSNYFTGVQTYDEVMSVSLQHLAPLLVTSTLTMVYVWPECSTQRCADSSLHIRRARSPAWR